jgi:predicted GNAT family N-acyltransferase
MVHIQCHIAETRRQIDDALRVRYQVFAEELGYLYPDRRFVPREVDPFDTLETTIHLVAFADGEPVGVARLLTPNSEVARNSGAVFGIDLESKFDLSPLAERGLRLAETTRYCVLARFRGRAVAAALHAAAIDVSLDARITHWIGCANTETDSLEDARLIREVAARLGFEHGDIRIEPRAPAAAPTPRAFRSRARSSSTPAEWRLDSLGRQFTTRPFVCAQCRCLLPWTSRSPNTRGQPILSQSA